MSYNKCPDTDNSACSEMGHYNLWEKLYKGHAVVRFHMEARFNFVSAQVYTVLSYDIFYCFYSKFYCYVTLYYKR